MDKSESIPIFILFGTMGISFASFAILPPYIGTYNALLTSGVLYFSGAPVILFLNLFAERDAGKHKITVCTVFGPWNDQDIMQFKFQEYHTEAIPGSQDNITSIILSEGCHHPHYGKLSAGDKVYFTHFGNFVGDNLKLGRGWVIHWGVSVYHSATDKLVLYESNFVRESRTRIRPVYKIKHSPKMFEYETGAMDREMREQELEELAAPGVFA